MSILNIFQSRHRPTWDEVQKAHPLKNELPYEERRDGKKLHQERESRKISINKLKADLSGFRGEISRSKTLIKELEKLCSQETELLAKRPTRPTTVKREVTPMNRGTPLDPNYAPYVDERTDTEKQLDDARTLIAAFQTKETNTLQWLKQAEQGLEEFLNARPRPHLQSNAEMIADYEQYLKLDAEFRRAVGVTPGLPRQR
jgi:hypothetical protein